MTSNAGRIGSVTMCLLLAQIAAGAEFAGGTGEPNDPYQIATAGQLTSIGSDPNLLDKHFVLLNDIDLDPNLPGSRVFTEAVIAPAVPPAHASFAGVFDGDGHTITNLVIDTGIDYHAGDCTGLFGRLGRDAVVRNLRVEAYNGGMYGRYRGALAGSSEGCIIDCHAKAFMVAGFIGIGGLVGYNDGDIIRSRAECDWIIGHESVGGLVGCNWREGRIIGCSAATSTIGLNQLYAGGLVGSNEGSISGSYATGNIPLMGYFTSGLSVANMAGGLVGMVGREVVTSPTISNCYAAVNISARGGASHLGGLVGIMGHGTMDGCYATGDISAGDLSECLGGLVGGTGSHASVMHCYSVGKVSAGKDSSKIGGLIGYNGGAGVKASFWDVEVSGLSESAGGTGLATSAMQDANTYEAAGWDLVGEEANGTADLWFIPRSGGYPVLAVLWGP